PDAPSDYRGPYGVIDTNVTGIRIGELLPKLSKLADKYALLRSVAHTGGGHPSGSLQILAGDPDPQDKIKPVYPDWMSVVSYLRRDSNRALPNYVAVNSVDHHAGNQHAVHAYATRPPTFGPAVSALIEDVYQRGLDKRVLVIVTGEFGRTPRISYVASSGGGVASADAGIVQPGRDHWPRANSMLFAGGGIRTGQVIGATDARGEDPIERRVGPGAFLATIYRHLGIDYQHIAIPNFAGRPVPILSHGEPIAERAAATSGARRA